MYYYLHSPLYNSKIKETPPSVRGATVSTSEKAVVPAEAPEGFEIHIPDGMYIRVRDTLGRFAGYDPQINGFENDIPYSEVVTNDIGGKYIRISQKVASEYILSVRGKNELEAVLIELKRTGMLDQSVLISIDTSQGSLFRVKTEPLLVVPITDFTIGNVQ